MRIRPQNPRENPKNPKPGTGLFFTHFYSNRVSAVGSNSGHHYCTCTRHGGAPPPDDLVHKISRPAAARRARIGPANTAAAATLGRRILSFSGHFRPPHSSVPPFLDPLNSFPWSYFADSSPFESYDENKVGRWLDRVFRPPHRLLDKDNGTDDFLVS